MTDYKQACERLRDAAEFALGGWSNVKTRDALRATLNSLAEETACEADYRCSPGFPCRVHTRTETFNPDAVNALCALIEEAHVRRWTELNQAVKRVRASERKP